MSNFNFAKKELKGSFEYSTIDYDRHGIIEVPYNGRIYDKHGVFQAVTAVGNVWEDEDGNLALLIGVTKQNPQDRICDKDIAIENAMINAFVSPSIVIYDIPFYFNDESFQNLMDLYVDDMRLDFIKTRTEMLKKYQSQG